jgi:two-component system sensor histidine kinase/response regulator
MNAIIGLSHLTLRTRLTPQQANYLKKIELSAQHLMDIINDVLDFSKIEAGHMALEPSAFDIDEMLSGVADMVRPKATEKGLAFVHFLDPAIPRRVVGDVPRLSQVLSNLAHNAVKFTDSGEVVISAYCKALQGAHVDVSFTVRDTGIGMNEAQVAQLFRSFSQADTSTTRRYGGTGLGLALSKQLVSLMGCPTIEVLSKPGQGSTFGFTLRLPVAEAEAESGFVPETARAPGLRHL